MRSLAHLAACLPLVAGFSESLIGKDKTVGEARKELESVRYGLFKREDTDPELLYPEYNFSVPIDHFQNESMYEPHTDGKFNLRYWFDAQYYKPGGPVIVLQSGETSGVGRLPFLQKGIVNILTKATNGIGVILEHRYYGTSVPTEDLSTENLRFLTTEQALADQAYFAQNVQFEGLEEYGDLTSETTAWITYGGSYAGAFVAFLRKIYPDTFFGAISSSGVPKAIYDYWEYYEPVAEYGPPECIATQRELIDIVDNILSQDDEELTADLQEAFGLPNVTYVKDFANTISTGIAYWQSLNWDPEVSSPEFYNYCNNITSTTVLHPGTEELSGVASNLIEAGGYDANDTTVTAMLNYIGYVNLTAVSACTEGGETQDQCFTQYNSTFYAQDSLDDTWRLWPYQYCTEWGYLQTGSGVPEDQLPVISRQIDLEYTSTICREAFNITTPPDVDRINKYGGYSISYPRLANIDGQVDPWRPAGPHAFDQGAPRRNSTASEPFILIEGAVHHWDENGVFANQSNATFPPQPVRDAQAQEVQFVQEWMQEWKLHCLVNGGCS
ncbi:hypothetical protein MBLNU230_g7202t1 [Neophaeotheca triangularis]